MSFIKSLMIISVFSSLPASGMPVQQTSGEIRSAVIANFGPLMKAMNEATTAAYFRHLQWNHLSLKRILDLRAQQGLNALQDIETGFRDYATRLALNQVDRHEVASRSGFDLARAQARLIEARAIEADERTIASSWMRQCTPQALAKALIMLDPVRFQAALEIAPNGVQLATTPVSDTLELGPRDFGGISYASIAIPKIRPASDVASESALLSDLGLIRNTYFEALASEGDRVEGLVAATCPEAFPTDLSPKIASKSVPLYLKHAERIFKVLKQYREDLDSHSQSDPIVGDKLSRDSTDAASLRQALKHLGFTAKDARSTLTLNAGRIEFTFNVEDLIIGYSVNLLSSSAFLGKLRISSTSPLSNPSSFKNTLELATAELRRLDRSSRAEMTAATKELR